MAGNWNQTDLNLKLGTIFFFFFNTVGYSPAFDTFESRNGIPALGRCKLHCRWAEKLLESILWQPGEMQWPMIHSEWEGQSRSPSWPQIPCTYELWKLPVPLINPIILIFHLHSFTAETPVSSCCKEIRAKSEAKLNHELRHNPRVNYFPCSLKMGFAFMKKLRLMTLINWKGKQG